jgi:signal transduction histidine kinase/DNA-binding NarL/FixJ family response regulator
MNTWIGVCALPISIMDNFAKPRSRVRAIAVTSGLAIAAFGIFLLCLQALWTQQVTALRWMDHALDVLDCVQNFNHDFANAQNEGRGVTIHGDWDRVGSFETAARRSMDDLSRLRMLTEDNPKQHAHLETIEATAAERFAYLRDIIKRGRDSKSTALLPTTPERHRTWAQLVRINTALEELRTEEKHLLDDRRHATQRVRLQVWAALICFALVGAVCLSLALSLEAGRAGDRRHMAELSRLNERLERMTQNLIKARDSAERSNRAKTLFLAGMSHELRTPLTGILGYARLLRLEGGLNPTQSKRVDAMLTAGRHLLHMVARVLDLSEIEAERLELQNELISVRSVAMDCLELVRPEADRKGLGLELDIAADAPVQIVTDSMRLQQILLNLLCNAVKFTTGGAVELRILPVRDDSSIRMEVVDTGPGISPEQRARLFQDFERLDTTATRAAEGAGLGLSLSARLAAFLGGQLGLDDRPGGGSVFWLELPLTTTSAPSSQAPTAAEVAAPASAAKRAITLLVVDDILMNREIAAAILRAAGHDVTCVESGAEAVAAVAERDFDVVLMDVRMPEMDGLEATRRIRAQENGRRRLPILALTAQAFTEQIAECHKAGMDGHLVKPYDAETLLAAVVRAASSAGSGRAEPAEATQELGAELPIFDRQVFESTAAFLPPERMAGFLHIIAGSGDVLLRDLRAPGSLSRHAKELAEQSHALASSAGQLGFVRIAALGRRFEHAVKSGAADAAVLGKGLEAAIEVTLHDMNHWIRSAGANDGGQAGSTGIGSGKAGVAA